MIEVLKQALSTFEQINKLSQGENAICLPAEIDDVMESLEQAIAELEKQEPVACIGTNGELMWLNKPKAIYSKAQPLYTSPPQRQWAGLTIQEVSEAFGNYHNDVIGERQLTVYMAIEAKLKEKNT
jgi:hypothetical protein